MCPLAWRRKPKGETHGAVNGPKTFTGGDLHVTPSNHQHIGSRENQEDSFALSDLTDRKLVAESGVLALVADGMGGLALGEEASRVAVQVFLREHLLRESDESAPQRLHRALVTANAAVFDRAYQDGEELELGTTMVATLVHKRELYWISVGDSRIYHLRNNTLTQLTRDHIYKNQLMDDVRKGFLTKAQAESHPEGAYLTSYLGLLALTEINKNSEPLLLEPGDWILLCSDGLYNSLTDEEIKLFLKNTEQTSAENLVKRALAKNLKHQDNITVVLLSCNSVGK